MSVRLHLTTYEKPLVEKLLKSKKIKLEFDGNGLDLSKDDYGQVSEALHHAYFKANFTKSAEVDTYQTILRKMEKLSVHFLNLESDSEEDEKVNDEEKKVVRKIKINKKVEDGVETLEVTEISDEDAELSEETTNNENDDA